METETGEPAIKDEEQQVLIRGKTQEQETPASSSFSLLPSLVFMLVGACYLLLSAPPNSAYRQKAPVEHLPLLPTAEPVASRVNLEVAPRSHPVPITPQQPLLAVAPVRRKPLRLTAAHPEYGPMDEETRGLYGWEVVLEAQADTLLTLHNGLPGATYEWRLRSADGKVFFEDNTTTATVTVRCPTAGMALDLKVTERPSASTDGPALPTRSLTAPSAVCKYVRREIRTLFGGDRGRYLDALAVFFRTPLAEGKRRFGPDFVNAAWITACHNSQRWCLHTADPFMAAHAAFVYWAEEVLRMIDPGVAIPYWDHMIDTVELGPRWADSPIFQDDWFGGINNGEGGTIPRGRFANLPVALGRKGVYDQYDPGVDEFGHLNLDFVQNGADLVTRSDSVCGLRSPLSFAPPENLFNCYEGHSHWTGANECMYKRVHNPMHSHVCGTWDCAHDLGKVYEQYSDVYSRELLAYIGIAGKHLWTGTVSEDDPDGGLSVYRRCNVLSKPRCSCQLDVEHIPFSQLQEIMDADLELIIAAYPGRHYIRRRSDDRYVFMSDGRDLSPKDNERLMRIAAKIWCEGAKDGQIAGMMSTNDPLFYTSHVFYDRIFHFLMTSPELKQTLNMTWGGMGGDEKSDSDCLGGLQSDDSPFPDFFRHPHGNSTLKMKNLGEALHPRNVSLPYVYDDIVHWGGRAWRPREHDTWQRLVKRLEEKQARQNKRGREAEMMPTEKADQGVGEGGAVEYKQRSNGGAGREEGGATTQETVSQVGGRVGTKRDKGGSKDTVKLAKQQAVGGEDGKEEDGEGGDNDEHAEKDKKGHSSEQLKRAMGRRLQKVVTGHPTLARHRRVM